MPPASGSQSTPTTFQTHIQNFTSPRNAHEDKPTFNPTAITMILMTVPYHVIFEQALAELLRAALTMHAVSHPDKAPAIWRTAFLRWAWNVTPDGELKEEPHLTLEEMGKFKELIGDGEELKVVPECSLAASAGEKRAREESESEEKRDEKRSRMVGELGQLEHEASECSTEETGSDEDEDGSSARCRSYSSSSAPDR